jgi:outer membrane protein assembly factor BamA
MFKVLALTRIFLLLCCVCDVSQTLFAQKKLNIVSPSTLPTGINAASYTYTDSVSLNNSLLRLVSDLHQRAYLEASVDSTGLRDSILQVWLHLGPPYQWGSLKLEGIPAEWTQGANAILRSKKSMIDLNKLESVKKELVQQAANAGYPFAQVRLDSVVAMPGILEGVLRLEKGNLYRFDTLILRGDAHIAPAYLRKYLGLQNKQLYDQSKLSRIRERIQELPFLQMKTAPEVEFIGSRALVVLELLRQKASRFDFIIGVLPNSQQSKKLLVTGSFEGELQNQFGLGERLYVRFEQLRASSPRLDLQFNYPFVANLPIGADFKLHLYRRDTAFLDLDLDLGLQYLLEGGNYLKVFWNQRSSRLLQLNESQLLKTRALPATLDVSYASFGLEFRQQKLDYRLNPRRGWALLGRGGAGTKRILPNNRITELGLAELYDTLQLRIFQYRLLSESEAYLPLGKHSTLKLKASTGWTIANQPILLNEQFRIGGNRLLRGFNEEIVFATNYAVGSMEYRLLLNRNSFLYSFLDYAWIANHTTTVQEDYRAYGFGAGITFETKAGLFGLSLAFGTRTGTALDFAGPKVHFGYVSLF